MCNHPYVLRPHMQALKHRGNNQLQLLMTVINTNCSEVLAHRQSSSVGEDREWVRGGENHAHDKKKKMKVLGKNFQIPYNHRLHGFLSETRYGTFSASNEILWKSRIFLGDGQRNRRRRNFSGGVRGSMLPRKIFKISMQIELFYSILGNNSLYFHFWKLTCLEG